MTTSEPPRKVTALRNALTKAQLYAAISEDTGLSKRDISRVFESLAFHIHRHLKKRAVGVFTLPGLCKFEVMLRKARKERRGVNPFTGEETLFKAKPAHRVVKVRALKKVHDMAESA